jgi:hypothetical protein
LESLEASLYEIFFISRIKCLILLIVAIQKYHSKFTVFYDRQEDRHACAAHSARPDRRAGSDCDSEWSNATLPQLVSIGYTKVTPHKVERIAAQPATRDVTQPIRTQRGKLQTNQ